jgi:hypothetical protein
MTADAPDLSRVFAGHSRLAIATVPFAARRRRGAFTLAVAARRAARQRPRAD